MAVSSATGGSASVSGLASGIDSAGIIDAFIKADRASTALMETRRVTFQTRLEAVRLLNTRLLSHQLDLAALNAPSLYTSRQAVSSNVTALTSTATSAAAAGTYQFEVVNVAKAKQLATGAQSSATTTIGAGTVNLQLGSGTVTTLTIDAANSSLNGIAQAINAAGAGVSASVLNDGTGYRLLMTSADTGVANAVSVTGGGALGSLFTAPGSETSPGVPDPQAMLVLQAAVDAQLKIGSGAFTVTQASNTFSNVIQGVELKALAPGTSTVTVGVDGAGALSAAKTFVASYNNIVQFMADNASYNGTTKAAGSLFSDGTVRNGVATITQALLSSASGGTSSMSTLTSLGMTIDRSTGKLTLDEGVFQSKLSTNPSGVAKVFANSGVSSNSNVQFGSLTPKTVTTSPFVVATTQIAEQAQVTGAALVTAPVDINMPVLTLTDSNHTLNLKMNGRAYQVTLANGSYSGANLAKHLQTVLDQKITVGSDRVTVGFDGTRLSLTGVGYGVSSTVQVTDSSSDVNSANSVLKLSSALAYGQDVVGTINGVNAVGTGQTLTGTVGTSAEGLRLSVTSSSLVSGATVTVSKGIAQIASERVKQMTDGGTGTLANVQSALDGNVTSLTKSIDANDARLAIRRKRYQTQFLAMEKSIQASNSMGQYITSQIKGLEKSTA
jgi:flagellar hook-associated protein 2